MPIPLNAGRWKRALFSLLGASRGRTFLAKRVRKKATHSEPFTFPIEGASFKRVLLILPPDRLQTLFQIDNASALVARFPNAQVTLLAESLLRPLAAMIGAEEVLEYTPEEKLLFSPAFAKLYGRFRDQVDCCCLLTREEDLPLLYLTCLTGARLRVGYGDSADFPFINLRIDSSPDKRSLIESNCAMAEALGARDCGSRTWVADDFTSADIDYLFKEIRLDGVGRLIGIDVLSLFRLFGEKGAEECIAALMTSAGGGLYFYCEEAPPRAIAGQLDALATPLFSALTIPQIVTLLRRTECIIAGKTLFFGLALLLGKKTVGIFSDKDLPLYCKPSSRVRGISCSGKGADMKAITAMVGAVRELMGR